MRKNIMILAYHLLDVKYRKEETQDKIRTTKYNIQKYSNIISQLEAKTKKKKAVVEKMKTTSVFHISRHRKLAKVLKTLKEEKKEIYMSADW